MENNQKHIAGRLHVAGRLPPINVNNAVHSSTGDERRWRVIHLDVAIVGRDLLAASVFDSPSMYVKS